MSTKQQKEYKFRNWKNTKFASMAWILVILILVIAVIINMIVMRLDFNWDISANKQFSLSNTTESYLSELDEQDVTVDFYLLADMNDIENDINSLTLYRVLRAYENHDCINLIDFDPNVDTETLESINPDEVYSLSTGDMIIRCGNNTRRIPGSSMYLTYTDDEGNTIDEEFSGENLITGTIKSVVEDFTPTVYFLTGHGEKSLDQYTTFTNNLINYNYLAKELNLSETDAVPDDAALILVAAPTADITEAEEEILNTYLEAGGNITLMMSPNDGEFAYTNLENIMENYGFHMDYDRVYETNSNYHLSGDNTMVLCQLTELEDDSEAADLTSSLINQGIYTFMPESRSFTYYDEGGKYTIASLITTYDTAVGEPYGGVSDDPEEIEGTNMILAAHSTNNAWNSSKMVVFGNAEFLDDEHITSETIGEAVIIPVYLMLSTISWMYDSDMDMGIDAKSSSYDYIALQNESFATTLIVVLTIIPIVILVIGVAIWVKRRNS